MAHFGNIQKYVHKLGLNFKNSCFKVELSAQRGFVCMTLLAGTQNLSDDTEMNQSSQNINIEATARSEACKPLASKLSAPACAVRLDTHFKRERDSKWIIRECEI